MSTYKTPGVYVEEITKLPPSVAAVETAIPAFVGFTEKARGLNGESLENKPTRITSMLEFEQYFGGPKAEDFQVTIHEPNTTNPARWVTVAKPANYQKKVLYYQMQLFFANGGGPCYIVSVGDYSPEYDSNEIDYLEEGVGRLALVDEPTLVVCEVAGNASVNTSGFTAQLLLNHCSQMKDRFAILDTHPNFTEYRTVIGNNNLKYGAAYYPNLNTSFQVHFDKDNLEIFAHKKTVGGVEVDIPLSEIDPETGDPIPSNPPSLKDKKLSELDIPTRNLVLAELRKNKVGNLPPSFAVAGVYARTDSERGVWKAPANTSLSNVTGLTITVDDSFQAMLNVDADFGKSINAIRAFTGKGILVWGARTLAGNDAEWRYVSVRRFFTFVEESCKKSTSWAVFEPNDAGTWMTVKSQIENFLNNLWREGALMGSKPEQAYYVKVGLNQTMTQQEVLDGYLNVEIGMAAVRPAEFIVLKFSHLLPQS